MNIEHADFIFLWMGRLMGIAMGGLCLLWVWTAMTGIFLERANLAISFLAFLRFRSKTKAEMKEKPENG